MADKLDPFAVPDLSGADWQEYATIVYEDKRPKATERSNFSGSYDLELLRDIALVSKEKRVDPYVMIGIGLQETRLGQTQFTDAKSGHVFNLESNPLTEKQEKATWEQWKIEAAKLGSEVAWRRQAIRRAAMMFKRKEQIAKSFYRKRFGRKPTKAEIIQGWQGYGQIPYLTSFGSQKNLVGWRDIPHGKRILDHVESLKQNLSIQAIVEDAED